MGLVYAEIELINAVDLGMLRRYKIGNDEVKRMTVKMMVDSSSVYMFINETVREQLDLAVLERRKGQLSDGSIVEYDVVGPIEVKFKNRRCVVDAMVLPGDNEMLLGAIPLEDMPVRLPSIKPIGNWRRYSSSTI
jgi:hypothetical protein